MKKILILLVVSALLSPPLKAQTSDEAAVKDVIIRLFTGMEKGDSAMVHSTFAKEVSLLTVFRDKNNNPKLRRETSIDEFLKAVGTPHPEIWYEEVWNIDIKVDGDFAQGWCDYAFYIGDKFSHCGIDAFQLFRGRDGWKIVHLADTRRGAPCDIPKDVQQKHHKP